MSPPTLQLLIAALLVGLSFILHFPLTISGERRIDALDAALLMLALVNLRLAWGGANAEAGGRAPAWFVLAGLVLAALITYAMFQALTPK